MDATVRLDAAMACEMMREAGLEPLVPYPGSARPWKCTCTRCNREVSPQYRHIKAGQKGCKDCGYATRGPVGPAKRWTDREAAAVMRRAGLEPIEVYPGTMVAPWACRCATCGAVGRPRLSVILRGEGGCFPCGIRKRSDSIRLSPEVATSVMRAVGLEPLEEYPGKVGLPWRAKCIDCEQVVAPLYASVQQGRAGCPCARLRWIKMRLTEDSGSRAVRASRCAGVYLMTHPELHAVKVGIGVAQRGRMQRLASHRAQGWLLHRAWMDLASPEAAFLAEQAVLQQWRRQGISPAVSQAGMPQGGHTETAPLDRVDMAALEALIDSLVQPHRKVTLPDAVA